MKIGTLLKHPRDGDIGIIVKLDEDVKIFWFSEGVFGIFKREYFQSVIDDGQNKILDNVDQ